MSEVKSKIESLEKEKEQLNPSDVNDKFRIQQIDAEIAGLQATLEQAEREQKKQETLSDYVDIVSQMFEALFPSEKYRPLFGITEYEEKRAQFYQLNHAYVTEKIEAIHQENELALALKDERYRLLNDQALRVQEQLDEAGWKITKMEEEIDVLIDKYSESEKGRAEALRLLNETKSRLNNAEKTIEQLRHEAGIQTEQIATLQEKLEAAQKPKEESKPSQKLSDMLTEIKSKNTTDADEWIARWNARQKSDEVKIPLPEINVPELTESPFRDENNTADAEEYRISPPEVDAPVGGSFQIDEEFTQAGPIEIPTQQPNGEVVAKTVEERLEALERAVFGVNGQVA